jgi:hypothetical protein
MTQGGVGLQAREKARTMPRMNTDSADLGKIVGSTRSRDIAVIGK